MSNLTNNRGSTTANQLNNAWADVRTTLHYLLPEELYDENGLALSQMTLEESDPEASEVISLTHIPRAFQNKALRRGFTLNSSLDLDVYDWIGDFGTGIVVQPREEEDLFGVIDLGQNFTNGFIAEIVNQNQAEVDRINNFFRTDWSQYTSNGSWMEIPNYINNNSLTNNSLGILSVNTPPYGSAFSGAGINNLTSSSTTMSASLANQLNTGSFKLLIGGNADNFIDINLNNSASNQYLSGQTKISNTTPVQTINIQNDKLVYENSFMQLNTGERVPISLLPQTTLQRALRLVLETPEIELMNEKIVLQRNGILNYDGSGSEAVITYERVISNESGQGWFSDGYLGTETFEDLGFNSWGVGVSKILTQITFGEDKDSFEPFGNSPDDWFINEPFELEPEENWNDFPEGVSPKNPSCGTSSDSNTVTEDISTQANGIATIFTISDTYESAKLKVYWNGQRQSDQTITELTSTTFRTSFVPQTGHVLLVDYTPL